MSNPEGGRAPLHTGGCQCGAVRFAVYAEPIKIGICHCRMCQKAVAGPFVVLAEVAWGDFAWTRGAPSTFRSSSRAVRDFCAACGTPLSYRHPDGPIIELLTGAFDEPQRVPPTYATGTESGFHGWHISLLCPAGPRSRLRERRNSAASPSISTPTAIRTPTGSRRNRRRR